MLRNYDQLLQPRYQFHSSIPDATHKITDISLEYEIVTQPNLARHISDEYQSMVLLYDRVIRQKQIIVNKKDTIWNWTFNMPCKSLKGILVLFEQEKPYERDTSKLYDPKIQKVSVIVEGTPNQLHAQGMRPFDQYYEAHKYFTEDKQKDNNANEVQAQLQLHNNNKKRSHTQLDSRKQVIAFQDRVITINIKEAQHPLK